VLTREDRQRRTSAERLAREIYGERRGYLLAIARRHSIGAADAEDALQEAFIAFIRSFDPDRGAHPLAWITLVLKRACWERRRREHLDRRAGQELNPDEAGLGVRLESLDGPTRSPQEWVELGAEVAELRNDLARLKEDERRALSLLAWGYSYEEIRGLTGWTYTKVNRCVAEGRARLRRLSARRRED
jgi:RNA polymerase sigma factor (sigma-70 family)